MSVPADVQARSPDCIRKFPQPVFRCGRPNGHANFGPWRRNPSFVSSERKGVVMSCKVISICEGACRSSQNRFEAFRCDELPPGTMRLLLRPVLACRRCLRELRGREPAVVPGETPPPELANRIIDRIREEAERVTPQSHSMKSFEEEGA